MSTNAFTHKCEVEFATMADDRMAQLVATRLNKFFARKDDDWFAYRLSVMSSTRNNRTTLYLCSTRVRELSTQQIATAQRLAKSYVIVLLPFFPKLSEKKAIRITK